MTRRIAVTTLVLLTVVLIQPALMAAGFGSGGPEILRLNGAPRPDMSHRLIVELQSPALAEWSASGASRAAAVQSDGAPPAGARLDVRSPAAVQYVQRLESEQHAFLAELSTAVPEARLSTFTNEFGQSEALTYNVVFNGVVVDAGLDADVDALASRLEALPGVKRVYRDRARDPDMYASLPLIDAPAAWDNEVIGGRANAGAGVKVASMDGGVHAQAPMFSGEGYEYPHGYPLGYTENTNGKIIVSRVYFRDWDPPAPGDDTPWPGEIGTSHGVHTSGTMAGNTISVTWRGVPLELGGVAPRAYVMSYRVFYGSINGIGSLYDAEGIAALEDIVRDGADVVNNSWGGGPTSVGGPGDPLDAALVNTWRAGVFVSMSNGNAGPGLGTGDHPSPEYINVGATTTAGNFEYNRVNVTAPEPVSDSLKLMSYSPASGWGMPIPEGEIVGPYEYLPAQVISPTNFMGCNPWQEGSFEGKVALISRGECQFGTKALHAEEAGAVMAIIHNDQARGNALVNMSAGDVGISVTIPAIFMGYANGVRLADWYDLHGDEARLELNTIAFQVGNTPDRVASFSSRGPGAGNILKPDIAAPGVNILSQGYGSGSGEDRHMGFGEVGGTSMAAPHVAGAAALLAQIHPDWGNDWIKSALMSTAKYTDVYRHDGTNAQPLDIGAGRLDLTNAADPGVIVSPPKLSFGQVVTGTQPSITLEVTGVGEAEEQYQLYTVFTGDSFTATTPVPGLGTSVRSVTVVPGESATFDVAWDTTMASYGDNQGYLVLAGENHQAHLPAWIRITPPRSDATVLIIDNDGSSMPTTTLRAIPNAPESFTDYVGVYTQTLENLRIDYDIWDADAHSGGGLLTVPDAAYLSQYDLVLYQTGDWYVPDRSTPGYTPPTRYDSNALVEYANQGGRVLAFGQDLGSSFGVPSSPLFYNWVLGGGWVQDSISEKKVFTDTPQILTGEPGTPFNGMVLDVSARGDGAGNQRFVDELRRRWDGQMMPFRYPMGGSVQRDGYVAASNADQPTLERPEISYPGRGLYFAFGLEGVNNDTNYTVREDLMYTALSWLLDEVTVEITPTIGPANGVTYFEAPIESTWGLEPVSYRWDFGDGSPYTDEIETRTLVAGHVYRRPGTYLVRVEATNDLGTKAIGELEITIGDVLEYINRTTVYLPVLKKEVPGDGEPGPVWLSRPDANLSLSLSPSP